MNKKEMTVHAALAELKVLNDRIEEKIRRTPLISANKASNTIINGIPIEDFKKNNESDLKSIYDLIAYRKAIKKAVTKSNAVTTVQIAGETYTVAEAIWMKNDGLGFDMQLLSKLSNGYDVAIRTCNSENEYVEDKARRYAEEMFPPSAADTKDREVKIAEAMETYRKQISYSVVSGIDCLGEIKKLQDMIDKFTSEVDSALSVSNATTTITIEW